MSVTAYCGPIAAKFEGISRANLTSAEERFKSVVSRMGFTVRIAKTAACGLDDMRAPSVHPACAAQWRRLPPIACSPALTTLAAALLSKCHLLEPFLKRRIPWRRRQPANRQVRPEVPPGFDQLRRCHTSCHKSRPDRAGVRGPIWSTHYAKGRGQLLRQRVSSIVKVAIAARGSP